jgi:hypothetical protein
VVSDRSAGCLTGVDLQTNSGLLHLGCDTVVFTGDWIPDHELARFGDIDMDAGSLGPVVDTSLRTSRPGVFAAGNLVHPVETADLCALDGRAVAASVAEFLRNGPGEADVVPGDHPVGNFCTAWSIHSLASQGADPGLAGSETGQQLDLSPEGARRRGAGASGCLAGWLAICSGPGWWPGARFGSA